MVFPCGTLPVHSSCGIGVVESQLAASGRHYLPVPDNKNGPSMNEAVSRKPTAPVLTSLLKLSIIDRVATFQIELFNRAIVGRPDEPAWPDGTAGRGRTKRKPHGASASPATCLARSASTRNRGSNSCRLTVESPDWFVCGITFFKARSQRLLFNGVHAF